MDQPRMQCFHSYCAFSSFCTCQSRQSFYKNRWHMCHSICTISRSLSLFLLCIDNIVTSPSFQPLEHPVCKSASSPKVTCFQASCEKKKRRQLVNAMLPQEIYLAICLIISQSAFAYARFVCYARCFVWHCYSRVMAVRPSRNIRTNFIDSFSLECA